MELGYSAGLWGLLGMAVPLIIHLLSKQRQQEIAFGSVRFLEETASDRARSIQLSQYALLLLRMLIVGLIAVMISAPTVPDQNVTKYLYLPDDLNTDRDYQALINNYNQEEYTYVNYNIEQQKICEDCNSYPSLNTLITSLNNDPDTAVLMTYGYQRDVIGRLPDLATHVLVIQLPLMSTAVPSDVIIADSMYQLRSMLQDGNTIVNLGSARSSDDNSSIDIKICLLSGKDAQRREQELTGLLNAIQHSVKYNISYDCNQADWIIAIDTSIQSTGIPIINWNLREVNSSFRWDGGSNYEIAGSLSSRSLQSTNLPLLLTEIITARKLNLERYDERVIDLSQLKSDQKTVEASVRQTGVGHYVGIIILLLIAAERLVSHRSNVTL